MGPSGSGKTTFLNGRLGQCLRKQCSARKYANHTTLKHPAPIPFTVLCGKVGGECVITGAVRVNGEHMPLDKLKKIMGFVPQDDIVHVDLTVR